MSILADKESVCSLCRCHIKENTLFTGLNDAQLDAFKEAVVINHHKKRELVFMEGDDCSGLYIIRTGRVKVVRSSSTGKEQIINIMNPGDLLGFEVFYNGRIYKNTAVAMEDCELCYIERHAFFKILENEPGIARKLILSLGRELNGAYERIGYLGLLNAREKLAHLLYTLAAQYGVKEDGGAVKLNLTLSRLEIAELLGITQETSIRLLKNFKEEGVIEIKRKEIIIKSLARLKALGE
jgi:CRP/FNR family cyclic AMP-dependent transcriptional regulator